MKKNKSMPTDQYLTAALSTKRVARKVFTPCVIEHIPRTPIKMTYPKKCYNKASVKRKPISGNCC